MASEHSGVYIIRNTATGCVYVGSASNLAKRWAAHRWLLNRGQHHNHALQADWTDSGPLAFDWVCIERSNGNGATADNAEARWIAHYRLFGSVYNQAAA